MSDQLPDLDKIISNAATRLTEHFDSVQIIATKTDGEQVIAVSAGYGNWYGRIGSVREWLVRREYEMTEDLRKGERPEGCG